MQTGKLGYTGGAALFVFALAACSSSQPGPAGPDPTEDPRADVTGAPTATVTPPDVPPDPTGTPSATASATPPEAAPTMSQLVAKADAAKGKALWEENHCAGCHGTAAKPPKKFPNVFAGAWADDRIDKGVGLIKKGKSPMPAFGDKLEDAQIADLLAFMKSGGK